MIVARNWKAKGTVLAFALAIVMAGVVACGGDDDDDGELPDVKEANDEFDDVDTAVEEGWVLVEGLDHCFDNPGVGAMGFHYINTGMLDLELDELSPEAFVYEPQGNGDLELGAVEWIVPADPWDEAGNTGPPEIHGHHLHLNEALGVYVLHAWLWKENPAGTFEDWNPDVSCPAD